MGWFRSTARWLIVAALFAGSCGNESEHKQAAGTDTEAPSAAGKGVKTDVGVTASPCPGSAHSDRGCIYLGTLSDLTGPFAALAVPATAAQKAFWDRVNRERGIGGAYDVDVATYTRDNKYNPATHVARYQEIQPKVLALAQSLGTAASLAALPLYKRENVIAVPGSFWSGWEFEANILESGSNYCMEAMNGLDYAVEHFHPGTAMAVHFAGDYGGDYAAGFEIAARARGLRVLTDVETQPKAVAGSQEAAIDAIVRNVPDVVGLAVSPGDMAEIVGGAVARGFPGRFIGAVATWTPGLLDSPAASAIEDHYLATGQWGPFGTDSPGHRAMREALGGVEDPNEGYTLGWGLSYPLKSALEQAVAAGDLTRAGLVAAASHLQSVDYEGMLPAEAGTFAGEPTRTVFRQTLVAKPDRAAPTGLSVVKDFFAGPTAATYPFEGPCQPVGK
jgi:ABC-type branched-subunit amino acid transport system substrate-binding protein